MQSYSIVLQSANQLYFMIKSIYYLSFLLLLAQICFSCDPGKYLTANGDCMQCGISCSTCTSSDGCNTCYQQMFLVARGNQLVCQVCYMINKGCDICLTATKCSSCGPGYFLQSDNTCVGCDNYIPNCLFCSGNDTISCLSCISPYHLVNGSCQISNSAIRQSSSINSSINAAQNSQPSGSITCDQSEVSINEICYPSIAFCQTYNQSNGRCKACISGFVLSNGYCLPSFLITSNNNSLAQSASINQIPLINSNNSTTPSVSAIPINKKNVGPQNCKTISTTEPTSCLVCLSGFIIIDAFPGVCFPLN